MKIAVIGPGAVGSFYGAKLARADQELHLLLRSDYDVVRRRGLLIRSPQGNFRIRPHCARNPEEIGLSDLVLIALKTTANAALDRLLPQLVGPQTMVVTLQNGLGNEEAIARLVPANQILGGLCFVCLNRIEPGLVHHIDHGMVVLGEFQRPPEARTLALAELFQRVGVPCNVTHNLAQAHWEKLTWNIPFNGLGVAGVAGYDALSNTHWSPALRVPNPRTLTTDLLLADPNWSRLAHELMLEVSATARALGFDVPDSIVDKQFERTRTMGAYKASTLIDFERGQALELESLFVEPLRQAQAAEVSVPRLEALCRLLKKLDPAATPSPTPNRNRNPDP